MEAGQANEQSNVSAQLTALGISNYSQHKHVVTALKDTLRPNEQIQGAIIGRNANRWSAMLVATLSLIHI